MFDHIDRKIIEILQVNAEKSVVEIAEAVGLSHTPCWRRIKRMEDMGLIRSRVALIDRRMANVPMTIFISVKVPRHTTPGSTPSARKSATFPRSSRHTG